MARPLMHDLWGAFAATAEAVGFGRHLLSSDAQFDAHGGPELWGLFLGGAEVGRSDRLRSTGLTRKSRYMRERWRARLAAGACGRCGGESGGRRVCDRCRALHRTWVANYKDRLRGGD
jgi:hypothetical protein